LNKNLKYFQKLGIDPTNDLSQIKKAYRKKAMHCHPDRNDSENAQSEFIELTEAYEIITGQQTTVQKSDKVRTANEMRADKIKEAKKRYQKMQQTEREKDAAYFEKITTGIRWNIFRYLAFYTAFFGVLLTVDYFATGKQKAIPEITEYGIIPKTIFYENELFVIEESNYWQNNFPPVQMNYSLIFGDLRSINVIDDHTDPKQIKSPSDRVKCLELFEQHESQEFYSYASVYYVFPFYHIFTLLPLLLTFYKRPSLNFSIWRLVSIWVIFPSIMILTFSNNRIFHLFGLF